MLCGSRTKILLNRRHPCQSTECNLHYGCCAWYCAASMLLIVLMIIPILNLVSVAGERKAACWPLQTACHLTLPPLKQSSLCSHRLCGHRLCSHRPCSHRFCTNTTGGLLPTCNHASRCHHRQDICQSVQFPLPHIPTQQIAAACSDTNMVHRACLLFCTHELRSP